MIKTYKIISILASQNNIQTRSKLQYMTITEKLWVITIAEPDKLNFKRKTLTKWKYY